MRMCMCTHEHVHAHARDTFTAAMSEAMSCRRVSRPLMDQADVEVAGADGLLLRRGRRGRRLPSLQPLLCVQVALRQAGHLS